MLALYGPIWRYKALARSAAASRIHALQMTAERVQPVALG